MLMKRGLNKTTEMASLVVADAAVTVKEVEEEEEEVVAVTEGIVDAVDVADLAGVTGAGATGAGVTEAVVVGVVHLSGRVLVHLVQERRSLSVMTELLS